MESYEANTWPDFTVNSKKSLSTAFAKSEIVSRKSLAKMVGVSENFLSSELGIDAGASNLSLDELRMLTLKYLDKAFEVSEI